jgi:hypothetical protein
MQMQTAKKTERAFSEKKREKSGTLGQNNRGKKKIAICMNFSLAFCAKVW